MVTSSPISARSYNSPSSSRAWLSAACHLSVKVLSTSSDLSGLGTHPSGPLHSKFLSSSFEHAPQFEMWQDFSYAKWFAQWSPRFPPAEHHSACIRKLILDVIFQIRPHPPREAGPLRYDAVVNIEGRCQMAIFCIDIWQSSLRRLIRFVEHGRSAEHFPLSDRIGRLGAAGRT